MRLAEDLSRVPDGRLNSDGLALGRRAAAAILTRRAGDRSQHAEPRLDVEYLIGDAPGEWRMIALRTAEQRGSTAIEPARRLAPVNVAMADAGIAIWDR